MNPTAGWNNFLSVEAGAAASLAGLLFVAVSININKILEFPSAAGRAAESLALLVGVLIIGSFGLVPNASSRMLGWEFFGVAAILWLLGVILHAREFGSKNPWYWLFNRVVSCQLATVPLCIAGILLIRGHASGMYWLVPGCIFSFVAATTSAWVLLIEILR